jgi:hypothetical protein
VQPNLFGNCYVIIIGQRFIVTIVKMIKNIYKMKNLFLSISLLLFGAVAFSQPRMQLLSTEHDFGVFKEEAGRQTFNFIVTNTGDSALVIKNVVPSCGCTTPEWTRSPIPPKGQGKVTAIYDPLGRPGVFNKTLTVHTNSKPEVVLLVIKGEVKAKEKTVEEIFTFPVGSVRFESNHMAFTNVKKSDKKMRVMPVINTSNAPVKLEFDVLPPHLQLKANPETLKPGQKGLIEGTYDATKNQGWGNVMDMVKIKIDGVVQNNIYFNVSANLVEDFSGLSKEELLNPPVFKLAATTVDIGAMPQATNKEVEFKYSNEGKRDLIIRFVKATCGCTAIQQGGMVVKPGQESSIKATFNSGSYPPGKVTKAIYVYTNDPVNSEVVLFLTAEIVAKTPDK